MSSARRSASTSTRPTSTRFLEVWEDCVVFLVFAGFGFFLLAVVSAAASLDRRFRQMVCPGRYRLLRGRNVFPSLVVRQASYVRPFQVVSHEKNFVFPGFAAGCHDRRRGRYHLRSGVHARRFSPCGSGSPCSAWGSSACSSHFSMSHTTSAVNIDERE